LPLPGYADSVGWIQVAGSNDGLSLSTAMKPRVNKSMGFPAQLSNHQLFNQDPERRVQLATLEILTL
jgi:hypothetical protein